MDLALNNLQRLICHKTQQTNHLNVWKQTTDVKLLRLHNNTWNHFIVAQSAGAVEYTDSISAER